jgi:hypothetical protein
MSLTPYLGDRGCEHLRGDDIDRSSLSVAVDANPAAFAIEIGAIACRDAVMQQPERVEAVVEAGSARCATRLRVADADTRPDDRSGELSSSP